MRDCSYHERIKEEKRTAVIHAAMELFLAQGYERTSLQQIGKRADVSTATLFKRFSTKAALFEAMVEEFWAVPPPCPDNALSENPAVGLRKMGVSYALLMRGANMQAIYRLIISEATRFPFLGQTVYDRVKGPFLKRLEDYLQTQVAAGRMAIDNIETASNQFLAVITGQSFWPELIGPGCGGTKKDVEHVVEEAVKLMLARYAA